MGERFVYSSVTAKPISFPLPVLWDLIALVFLSICVIRGCELVGVNLAYFNFDSYDFIVPATAEVWICTATSTRCYISDHGNRSMYGY